MTPKIKRGDRITAKLQNQLIDSANKPIQTRRGFSDGVSKEFRAPRLWVIGKAFTDIPSYSIFTIEEGDASDFDPRNSVGNITFINVALSQIWLTFDERDLGSDASSWAEIIGDEKPHLLKYTSADGIPSMGDEIGPVNLSYEISVNGRGLIAVSEPDTENNLIWIVRQVSTTLVLVELCLAVNHPGRGIPFIAYLGVWNSSSNGWDYTCEEFVTGIDWRYGTPYPDAGARGLFIPRVSATYGTIYECVSLDCESPGPCCG